jgi:hypothetical protein
MAVLVQAVAVALALWCCGAAVVASAAASSPPLVSPKAKPGVRPKLPPKTKLTTITFSPHHKRDYQVTCTNTGRRPCVVSCPSNCPNKCLVACAYCLTFCSTHAHIYISIIHPSFPIGLILIYV